MIKLLKIKIITSSLCLLFSGISHAAGQNLDEAQTTLKNIQYKISKIKQNIHLKEKKHIQIQQMISKKNQQIQETHAKKITLMKEVDVLEAQIQSIRLTLNESHQKINTYQKMIYNHLNIHLKLAEETYWQIIFSAKNPLDYYHRLDLYQYLYHSEQKALKKLKQERLQLSQNQTKLSNHLSGLNKAKQALEQKELAILQEKKQQTLKLNIVQSELSQNNEELKNIQKNQAQLRSLVQNLLKENSLRSNRPFTVMRSKLKYPVDIQNPVISKVQNGIVFSAPENAKVHAVSSGKVVFADWLNGYGYLVIIDHGWGFMSLYGNNQNLLRHKGDYVHQGDIISTVGKSGTFHKTGLYFEIRQKAHVVSALSWFQHRKA